MKLLVIAGFVAVTTSSAFAEKKCIFGDTIHDLAENKRFSIREDVIKTFKIPRQVSGKVEANQEAILVAVDVVTDKKTKRSYHLNRTFMDRYDGGNTSGWIEDVTKATNESTADAGKVVANIGDSDVYECQVRE